MWWLCIDSIPLVPTILTSLSSFPATVLGREVQGGFTSFIASISVWDSLLFHISYPQLLTFWPQSTLKPKITLLHIWCLFPPLLTALAFTISYFLKQKRQCSYMWWTIFTIYHHPYFINHMFFFNFWSWLWYLTICLGGFDEIFLYTFGIFFCIDYFHLSSPPTLIWSHKVKQQTIWNRKYSGRYLLD